MAAVAISTTQPNSPFGETYAALDVALACQTRILLEKLQDLGLLSRQADASRIGEVIFNNTNMNFMTFVKSEEMTMDQLRQQLRCQHTAILQGWLQSFQP